MHNLIQEPIEEVKTLRGAVVSQRDVKLAPGDVVEVSGAVGGQVKKAVSEVSYIVKSVSSEFYFVKMICSQLAFVCILLCSWI